MINYIGQIKLFAFDFVPKGWLPCDGRFLKISEYEPLHTLLRNTYGDNTTPADQFKLPDLRGVVPVHRGKGTGLEKTYVMGKIQGSAEYVMKPEHVPPHSHEPESEVSFYPPCSTGGPNTPSPVKTYPATIPGKDTYAAKMTGKSCITALNSQNVSVQPTGGNKAFSLLQPCMGMNYCINYSGIYPSQP